MNIAKETEKKGKEKIGVSGMKIKKILYVILGCIGVGLGAVGAVLPLLPSFPFLLLAAFCFARSSEKLNNWFINTRLYKENLDYTKKICTAHRKFVLHK